MSISCGAATRSFIAVAVVCMSLIGCREERPEEPIDFSEVLPFETLGIGQHADFSSITERIIYDAASWDSLSASLRPYESFRAVDFSQTMLALIAIPTESGGYSIDVESVELEDGQITVAYQISEPGPDCITPPALAIPFLVIEIRRTDGPVRFERRIEDFSCVDF